MEKAIVLAKQVLSQLINTPTSAYLPFSVSQVTGPRGLTVASATNDCVPSEFVTKTQRSIVVRSAAYSPMLGSNGEQKQKQIRLLFPVMQSRDHRIVHAIFRQVHFDEEDKEEWTDLSASRESQILGVPPAFGHRNRRTVSKLIVA